MSRVVSAPLLRSSRLVLRQWRDEDLVPFAAMGADPAVMEYFPELLTRERSDAMVGRIRAHFRREGFGLWALEAPGIAPFIGFTGLARPVFMPVVEIGWRLDRAFWGQGFATEAAMIVLDWAFHVRRLDAVVAFVVPSNLRSQRVMDRVGLARDPEADFDHPMIPSGHPLCAHWLYRLPTRRWTQNAPRPSET